MSRATLPPLAVAAAAALVLHGLPWLAFDAVAPPPPVQIAGLARPPGLQTRTLAPATEAAAARPIPRPIPQPISRPIPAAKARPAPTAAVTPLTVPAPASVPAGHIAQPAPPLRWQYRLQQDTASGQALLHWQPAAPLYTAQLERRLDARPALPAWHSRGRLESDGLAPERYAEQREGRDRRATNFRHTEGLLSYSASAEQLPLPAGVQDRLSWMLQLAALLAASPALREPGARIALPVAGLRGAVGLWLFELHGPQDLLLPIGPVPAALRLERAALGPYDGTLEVWLDPARHYLPVRLRQGRPDATEPRWEMLLESELAQP